MSVEQFPVGGVDVSSRSFLRAQNPDGRLHVAVLDLRHEGGSQQLARVLLPARRDVVCRRLLDVVGIRPLLDDRREVVSPSGPSRLLFF